MKPGETKKEQLERAKSLLTELTDGIIHVENQLAALIHQLNCGGVTSELRRGTTYYENARIRLLQKYELISKEVEEIEKEFKVESFLQKLIKQEGAATFIEDYLKKQSTNPNSTFNLSKQREQKMQPTRRDDDSKDNNEEPSRFSASSPMK